MNLIKNDKIVNSKIQDRLMKSFLIIELFLYVSFLLFDFFRLTSNISNILKYISICLCLTFVFFSFLMESERSKIFMLIILLFTVISDTFLLFSSQFEIGILSFIIVQTLYSRKIKVLCRDGCRIYMIEVLGIAFLWNIIVFLLKNEKLLTPTIVLASLYFLIFTGNMIRIWIQVNKNKSANASEVKKQTIALAIGLTLFYLCDINVGLNFLHNEGNQGIGFINTLTGLAGNMVWFFYLPSQVILTLNGISYK